MPELEFREAALQDEAALMPMMRSLAEQEPGKIVFDEAIARATFRRFLTLPQFGRIWLVFDGVDLAGYIILTIGFSFEFHGHDAFIDELYIAPAYRRRGFGRRAVEYVEQMAREMGVNAIHLEVDDGNDPALELYRRTGYEDHDRFLMTKWVDRKQP
ncbi:MAG TPA: GNAT family N-acetyltransferase [Candidatus Acidoferrum sp.]|nr:GNAT family N-acetyltransferase [Candidatus Acidoferrum sp.]